MANIQKISDEEAIDKTISLIEPIIEIAENKNKLEHCFFNTKVIIPTKPINTSLLLFINFLLIYSCSMLALAPKETSMYSMSIWGLILLTTIVLMFILNITITIINNKTYKKELTVFNNYNAKNLEFLSQCDISELMIMFDKEEQKYINKNVNNKLELQAIAYQKILYFEKQFLIEYKKITNKMNKFCVGRDQFSLIALFYNHADFSHHYSSDKVESLIFFYFDLLRLKKQFSEHTNDCLGNYNFRVRSDFEKLHEHPITQTFELITNQNIYNFIINYDTYR